MSNFDKLPAAMLDPQSGLAAPRCALNCDIFKGVSKRRQGYKKFASLPDCHSPWRGHGYYLVMSGQDLYRLEGEDTTQIAAIPGPRARMEYLDRGTIYMSNGYWRGAYEDNVLRSWGVSLPPAPAVVPAAGDWPPGEYKICYTNTEGTRLGGNGPVLVIGWSGNAMGLQLTNRPADALVWMTHVNGDTFFQATVGDADAIESLTLQKLPTLAVDAPPAMRSLQYAHGRVWGVYGQTLLYSDEFRPEWFRPQNAIAFPEDLVSVAPTNAGLFVNSFKTTWFLTDRNVDKAEMLKVGIGAIPGTLTYAMVEDRGYEIPHPAPRTPTPVWWTTRGPVAGTATGHLVYVAENVLKVSAAKAGASFYRLVDGKPQTVMALETTDNQSGLGIILEAGKLVF